MLLWNNVVVISSKLHFESYSYKQTIAGFSFALFFFTGMLQREHPGIAISVKTRQAIRTILNNARDVIHELKGGGLLDEAEAGKLESVKRGLPCLHNTEINDQQ